MTEEGQVKAVSHLLTPGIMGIQDQIMASKGTLITHHLGGVLIIGGSLNHLILGNMGEEVVIMIPDQVPLVLVQAEDLSHHFEAQMVIAMCGLLEGILFADILNLLTRDNDLTRRTTVVVKARIILLTLHQNVCDVGEPIIAVFVQNTHGGMVPRANSVDSCMKLNCTEHAVSPLPQKLLSLDIAKYRIMKVK